MTDLQPAPTDAAGPPPGHPYAAEIAAERRGWYALAELVRRVTPAECLEPGYYLDPSWTIRDVVAHLGTWLAQAEIQLVRMAAGTYEGHAIDIDALNAAMLQAMQGQPWEVAWVQANSARTKMLAEWYATDTPSDEAAWWVRKAAAEHYGEHLPRLAEWVEELIARRRT
jgi:hypothetical protein